MDSCDVLIVGGGPAGSSCAWALRHSGLDVLIMDRATFPREKLCGGWITPLVLRELEIKPEEYAQQRTLQPITGFRISALGQRDVAIDCGAVVSYGIRRCEFDEYLLRRCGARVQEGVSLQTFERTAGGWVINGEIHAKLLVGAGGHFCPVAQRLSDGAKKAVVAQEVEFEMTPDEAAQCTIQSEVPELFFCRDLAGYAWCFRKGNFLNIGLGRLDHHRLADHVHAFVETLSKAGKISADFARRFGGHAYLLFGNATRKLVDEGVMLVGDSAGLAFPESGEGIRPAIESGLLAGSVISAAEGSYTRERLSSYQQQLRHRLSRRPSSVENLAKSMPHSMRAAVGRVFLRNRRFCEKVVYDWFLRSSDSPLEVKTEQLFASTA